MKHEMPALTEERRKEMVEWARGYLSAADMYVANFPDDKSGAAHRDLLKIAIAALTAEPVGARYRWVPPHMRMPDGSQFYGDWGKWKTVDFLDEANPGEEYQRELIYAAPPVPELKIPDEKPVEGKEEGNDIDYMEPIEVYDLGKTDGYNKAIAEVKRLNGIK